MIDLRSDTVTKPSADMRRAMASAEVGDDVYAEDPTVRILEERAADLLGFEAALFTVTGSLANLLAVRPLAGVGTEVLCDSGAHLARAELGAHGAVNGVTMRTWTHPCGHVDVAAIERLIAPDLGPFLVRTTCVSVENTHNFAGGRVQPLPALGARRDNGRLRRAVALSKGLGRTGQTASPMRDRPAASTGAAVELHVATGKTTRAARADESTVRRHRGGGAVEGVWVHRWDRCCWRRPIRSPTRGGFGACGGASASAAALAARHWALACVAGHVNYDG